MSSTRSTTDYKQFSFMMDNRQTARNHINRLKNAIRENPTILEVQPILVNEKMEIIDGQHRFVAASELGLPIHYTVVPGLNIQTAREMNVLQRRWGVEDYAMSYAKAGNENYRTFNEFRQEFPGLNITTIMTVLGQGDSKALSNDFRNGKFVVSRELEEADWILEQISNIRNTVNTPITRAFVNGFLHAIKQENFDYDVFLKNLQSKPEMYHRTAVVRDALRLIEDIHNYNRQEKNYIRLY